MNKKKLHKSLSPKQRNNNIRKSKELPEKYQMYEGTFNHNELFNLLKEEQMVGS